MPLSSGNPLILIHTIARRKQPFIGGVLLLSRRWRDSLEVPRAVRDPREAHSLARVPLAPVHAVYQLAVRSPCAQFLVSAQTRPGQPS